MFARDAVGTGFTNLLLVSSIKLDLTYVEGIAFVNASDFEFQNTVEDIFIYTFSARHNLASNTEA